MIIYFLIDCSDSEGLMAKTRAPYQEEWSCDLDSPTLSASSELINVSPPQVMPKLSPKVFNKDDSSPVNLSHSGSSCSSLLVETGGFEESFSSFLKKTMAPSEYRDSENANFTKCRRTEAKFLENNNIKFCKENIPFQDIIRDSPHRRNKYLGMSHSKPSVIAWKEEAASLKRSRKAHYGKDTETEIPHEANPVAKLNSCTTDSISDKVPSSVTLEQEDNEHANCTKEQYVAPKRRKLGRPFGSKTVPKKLKKTKHSKRIQAENQCVKKEEIEDSRYSFAVGQDVLARWNDGLFYLGSVQKVSGLLEFEFKINRW